MTGIVKFHDIRKIEDNSDGTVTIHYVNPLSVVRAMSKTKGQRMDITQDRQVYTMTVEKGQLVNYYA